MPRLQAYMLLMLGVFTLLIAFKPSDFMEAYRATEVHALPQLYR